MLGVFDTSLAQAMISGSIQEIVIFLVASQFTKSKAELK